MSTLNEIEEEVKRIEFEANRDVSNYQKLISQSNNPDLIEIYTEKMARTKQTANRRIQEMRQHAEAELAARQQQNPKTTSSKPKGTQAKSGGKPTTSGGLASEVTSSAMPVVKITKREKEQKMLQYIEAQNKKVADEKRAAEEKLAVQTAAKKGDESSTSTQKKATFANPPKTSTKPYIARLDITKSLNNQWFSAAAETRYERIQRYRIFEDRQYNIEALADDKMKIDKLLEGLDLVGSLNYAYKYNETVVREFTHTLFHRWLMKLLKAMGK